MTHHLGSELLIWSQIFHLNKWFLSLANLVALKYVLSPP